MEELVHYSTTPLLADPPWPSRVTDVSTLQSNLTTNKMTTEMSLCYKYLQYTEAVGRDIKV